MKPRVRPLQLKWFRTCFFWQDTILEGETKSASNSLRKVDWPRDRAGSHGPATFLQRLQGHREAGVLCTTSPASTPVATTGCEGISVAVESRGKSKVILFPQNFLCSCLQAEQIQTYISWCGQVANIGSILKTTLTYLKGRSYFGGILKAHFLM